MSTDNLNSGGITTPRPPAAKAVFGENFSTVLMSSANLASDKPEISTASESETMPRAYKTAATTGSVPLSVGAPISANINSKVASELAASVVHRKDRIRIIFVAKLIDGFAAAVAHVKTIGAVDDDAINAANIPVGVNNTARYEH